MSAELLSSLDVVLNETDLHHIRVRTDIAQALVDLVVLTLPEIGPEPDLEGRIVTLNLLAVGRAVASLREGRWDDDAAPVTSFPLDDLDDVAAALGVQAIYGWDFFDAPDSTWQRLGGRLSLDVSIPGGSHEHTLDLFQSTMSGPPRHLDVRIWFGDLRAFGGDGRQLQLEELAAGSRRWWDALKRRDPRTGGHGIVSGGPAPSPPGQ